MKISIAILFLFSSAMPVFATDFQRVLKNVDGTSAEDCAHVSMDTNKCDRVVPLTLGRFVAAVLSQPKRAPTADDLIDERLAFKVIDGKEIDLTPEEITRIKGRMAEMTYNPVIIGQAAEAIDPQGTR